MKNEEDLTERQTAQLAAIRKRHKNVALFHWVKEQLRDVYRASSWEEAAATLDRLIPNTQEASDAALVRWGRTLRRWRTASLAYHEHRASNGYTEGATRRSSSSSASAMAFKTERSMSGRCC